MQMDTYRSAGQKGPEGANVSDESGRRETMEAGGGGKDGTSGVN